jgi:hypothetical protein
VEWAKRFTLAESLHDNDRVQAMHPIFYLYPIISLTTEENCRKPQSG